MIFEEAVKIIEDAGFHWTVEGGPDHYYSAAVQRDGSYVGDALAGPGTGGGGNPSAALLDAFEKEKSYEQKQQARSAHPLAGRGKVG